MRLAGEQRRWEAIARAIHKDAQILILDDATSTLDRESERAAKVTLDEWMRNRSTLAVAQRVSTF